jgi:hypothetical protein
VTQLPRAGRRARAVAVCWQWHLLVARVKSIIESPQILSAAPTTLPAGSVLGDL